MLGKTDTTHQGTTLDSILYHRQKLIKNPQLSTSSPNCPGSSEDRHSVTATHRKFLPNFPHLFLQWHHLPAGPEETRLLSDSTEPHKVPELKNQQVPRRPDSHQPELTQQCPKAKVIMGPEGPDSHHPGLSPKMYQS